MTRIFTIIASLFLLTTLFGCGSPVAPDAPSTIAVQARLHMGSYRLQALLSAYTAADVDHVRLTLFRQVGGSYQPTGATVALTPAELAQPFALGQLKLNSAYRVLAEAYAAPEESAATRISDPAGSSTDFQTQAIAAVGGIDTVDLSPVTIVAVRLKLTDRIYAGSASFTVDLSKALQKRVSAIRVTLLAGTSAVHQRTYPLDEILLGQAYPLQNLRLTTAYTLQAEGLDAAGALLSNSRNSTVVFTTPDAATGPVDDAVGGAPFTLPCK